MKKSSKQLKITAILGGTSIILGAFGAHALKSSLPIDQLSSYKTGVLYMMLHVIVLLIISLYNTNNSKVLNLSFNLILAGILLFSGSIFLLSTMPITAVDFSYLGPVTPIGGLLFIAGWFNLARL